MGTSNASKKSSGPQPVLSPVKTNGGAPGGPALGSPALPPTPPSPSANPNISPGFEPVADVLRNPQPATQSLLSDAIWAWAKANWRWILLVLLIAVWAMGRGKKPTPIN